MASYQLDYNGFTAEPGGTYRVRSIEGLDDPEFRVDEVGKAGADGSWIYAALVAGLHVLITGLTVSAPGNEIADKAAWTTAFAPQLADLPLTIEINGTSSEVLCKPVWRRYGAIDRDFVASGIAKWAVEVAAEDPTVIIFGSSS